MESQRTLLTLRVLFSRILTVMEIPLSYGFRANEWLSLGVTGKVLLVS